MPEMTDWQKFVRILANQRAEWPDTDDWDDVREPETRNDDGLTYVRLKAVKVGFAFDTKTGQFVGVYNWRD